MSVRLSASMSVPQCPLVLCMQGAPSSLKPEDVKEPALEPHTIDTVVEGRLGGGEVGAAPSKCMRLPSSVVLQLPAHRLGLHAGATPASSAALTTPKVGC
jgi:hypothetical protein